MDRVGWWVGLPILDLGNGGWIYGGGGRAVPGLATMRPHVD